MSGVGNEEQVRLIADQLFTVWDNRQKEEAAKSRRWWQSNASGWVGILVLAIGAITAANNINNLASDANARSIKNERAIDDMRITNADRLARIETKVDRLLEDK